MADEGLPQTRSLWQSYTVMMILYVHTCMSYTVMMMQSYTIMMMPNPNPNPSLILS